jgi:hypothetical protein
VNSALRKIGASRITSMTEGSVNAQVALDLYAAVRDDLLRSHPWNFAMRRSAQLAALAAAPNSEFAYQFAVPADYLRLVSAHDNNGGTGSLVYKIESDGDGNTVVLSGASDLWLRYVARITDTNLMPPDFREALAYELAANFALPIAQSSTLADSMAKIARSKRAKAASSDGQEDYPEQLPEGTWVAARRGGRGAWWPT